MASADFCRTRPQFPTTAPPVGQALLTHYVRQISLDKTHNFHCASSRFTKGDERKRFRDVGPTHRSPPALYRVSVRNLAALTGMWLTTILCQLTGTFAGFLPTVGCPSAVALVWYFVDRSHSWYTAYLKTFVLVQGIFTLQVNRHARRTKTVNGRARRSPASSRSPLLAPRYLSRSPTE